MWRWLPSLRLKKHKQFWLQLAAISLFGHCVGLSIILFRRKRKNLHLTVFSQPREVSVVLLPLYKHLSKQEVVKAKVVESKKPLKINKLTKPKAKPVATAKKQKVIAEQKPKVSSPAPKLKFQEQPEKSKAPAKMQPNQVVAAGPVSAKKVDPASKNEPKVLALKPEQQELKKVVADVEKEAENLVGRKDLLDLQIIREVEAAVAQKWRPPVGFGSDLACIVELEIDGQGLAKGFVIKKSAGVLLYDLSVRQALPQIIFPTSVRNQVLTVVFKP